MRVSQRPSVWTLTLIHPVEDCFQHLVSVAIAMLFPDWAILAPEHHELPITTTQSSKVGDLHNHGPVAHHTWNYTCTSDARKTVAVSSFRSASSPQELHPGRPQGDDPAGQPLPLHQRRGAGQLLRLHQAAGDAGGSRTSPRGYDDAQAVVPAASHWAASSVYHETHQEPVIGQKSSLVFISDIKPWFSEMKCFADPVWMGLATGLTLSDVSVAGLLGINESSSYSLGSGSGVCCSDRSKDKMFTTFAEATLFSIMFQYYKRRWYREGDVLIWHFSIFTWYEEHESLTFERPLRRDSHLDYHVTARVKLQ